MALWPLLCTGSTFDSLLADSAGKYVSKDNFDSWPIVLADIAIYLSPPKLATDILVTRLSH